MVIGFGRSQLWHDVAGVSWGGRALTLAATSGSTGWGSTDPHACIWDIVDLAGKASDGVSCSSTYWNYWAASVSLVHPHGPLSRVGGSSLYGTYSNAVMAVLVEPRGYDCVAVAMASCNVNAAYGAVASTLTAYAICMSVEPAGAFTTAKKRLLPASVKKAMKKRNR